MEWPNQTVTDATDDDSGPPKLHRPGRTRKADADREFEYVLNGQSSLTSSSSASDGIGSSAAQTASFRSGRYSRLKSPPE